MGLRIDVSDSVDPSVNPHEEGGWFFDDEGDLWYFSPNGRSRPIWFSPAPIDWRTELGSIDARRYAASSQGPWRRAPNLVLKVDDEQ